MELIKAVVPDDFFIFDMSDFHLGSPNCAEETLEKTIEYIRTVDNSYIVFKGDAIECILPNDKRYVHSCVTDLRSPKEQADRVIEMFQPVKDKILAWGIGNHCNSVDTEILTKDGWKRADSISMQDKIASYEITTQSISYNQPVWVGEPFLSECVTLTSAIKDEYVAVKHNFLYRENLTPTENVPEITRNRDYTYGGYLPSSELYYPSDITKDMVRLLTWVIEDGCIWTEGETKTRIQFKLSKQHKIDRLIAILNQQRIPYTLKPCKRYGLNKLQPHYIRIYGDAARSIVAMLDDKKEFPQWFPFMPTPLIDACFEELECTDGHRNSANNVFVTTTNINDANTIQLMGVHTNRCIRITDNICKSGFPNGKPQYRCSIMSGLKTAIGGYKVTKSTATPTMVMPIQSVDGTLIIRRNGKVGITGNCYKLWNTIDFGKYMADALGAPYGAYNFKISYYGYDNELMFKTYHTHGMGGLNSNAKDDIQYEANRKAQLKHKLVKSGHADCIYMSRGHDHQLIVVEPTVQNRIFLTDDGTNIKQQYTQPTQQNASYIPPDNRWYATTGSFRRLYSKSGLQTIDYGELAGYAPSEIGYAMVTVRDRMIKSVDKVVC